MIKYIFVAVVIFCALQSTIAQTAVMLPSVNPEYPNKCWLEGDKVAVAVGESYQPVGECKSYLCRDDFSFEILGCPTAIAPDGYQLAPRDNEKPYPTCCVPDYIKTP